MALTDVELIAALQAARIKADDGRGHVAADARDEFWELVSQHTSRIVSMATEWVDVCELMRDPRYSNEAAGIRIRNHLNMESR